jgi:hypothetical protein
MKKTLPNAWTDDELLSIMDETCIWTVNGNYGRVLCVAMSLRAGVERAATFAQGGAKVQTVCRQPSDNIIVISQQILQLAKLIERKEVPVFTPTEKAQQ